MRSMVTQVMIFAVSMATYDYLIKPQLAKMMSST